MRNGHKIKLKDGEKRKKYWIEAQKLYPGIQF